MSESYKKTIELEICLETSLPFDDLIPNDFLKVMPVYFVKMFFFYVLKNYFY